MRGIVSPSPPNAIHSRRVVGALALTQIVSWGILYYGFGVLVLPMQAELGWSLSLLSGAFSLALLTSALLAVPIGRWLERRGPRGVMTLGSCSGALVLFAWSHVNNPWAFYLLALTLGFPLATTLYEAAFAAVIGLLGRGRRADLSLLFLTVVGGLASTVFVPLAQWLVDEHGWRAALRILAAILALLTVPLHALVLSGPSDLEPPSSKSAAPPEPARGPLRLTSVGFALGTIAGTALGVYLVPILIEQGFGTRFAALTTGMIGVGQVAGRIGYTFLRPRRSLGFWSVALFLPCSLALACLAAGPPGVLVVPAVLLFFMASGAQTLGRTTWALELFGVRSFARINGVLGRWALVGRAGAPFAVGAAHDLFGSHGPGLVALAVLCLGGAACARAAGSAVESRQESRERAP